MNPIVTLSTALCICASLSLAGKPHHSPELSHLAKTAVDGDLANAAGAVKHLRDAGPEGLETLIAAHKNLLQDKQNPAYPKLVEAIKEVGAQRSCYLSQLYWYTDLEKAKAAALKSKKPILTLRMLGNLTDEYSCANSRFFRTTLYSNPKIAALLKENFVLIGKASARFRSSRSTSGTAEH